MALKKKYDVFIAYHGTYASTGSKQYADTIYDYLTGRGLKCFYFPKSDRDVFKANIVEAMTSRTFILVCTNGVCRRKDGKIDTANHYELSTEIDAFYAMTQMGEASVTDAKVISCGDFRDGDENRLHELFYNRTHLKFDSSEAGLHAIYEWVTSRLINQKSWLDTQITTEIKEVFATRASMNQSCRFDDLIATAKCVRAVGISNSELTSRVNPNAIKNCIENGGSIELLFLKPDGKYTQLREQEEGLRTNRIRNITDINIETAFDFLAGINTNRSNFKLYTYDILPRQNMIFIDDYLILQYYANKVPGIENPSFFIEKQPSSPLYDFCERAYNYLKSQATLLEMQS